MGKNKYLMYALLGITVLALAGCSIGGDLETWRQKAIEANKSVKYTVTFDANGATGTVPAAQKVTAGSTITLPGAGGLIKTGYTFNGWGTDASGTKGINYSAGSPCTVTGDITLYALWNLNRYTVTFNADGGNPAPVQQSIAHGGTVTQPGIMNKTGYGFGGWYKEATFTNPWDFAADTVTGNITLYAHWDTDFFTVTFYADGGAPAPGTQNIAHNGKVIEPPGMTRTGYTFDGWYTDNRFEYKWNFAEHTVTQNRTLYAKWNPVPVSGVMLNKTVIILTEGATEKLIATVHPADALNQSVSWGTSDPGKATVATDGTVTAVSAGTVTITVTTADGGKTATCTVTVQKPVSFTITFSQIADAAKDIIVDQVISLSGNNGDKTVELTVDTPRQYSSIEWHIPAVYISENGDSFILDSANTAYNSIGEHFLTLEVWKDSKPYNKTIVFTVAE